MAEPLPPSDPTTGTWRLKQIGLARLLHNLAINQRGGTLVLKRGEVSKSIFFKNGYVMFAESNLATDRLGEVLCRRGEITRAQLSECLAESKKSGKMLGAVLVEKQVLRAERLLPAIEVQVREIVLGAFSWDDGEYLFSKELVGNSEEILDLRIRTSDLIMEGVRRTYSAANSSKVIGNTQLPPRLSAESGYLSQDLTVNFEISKVLAKVDGKRTVAQIVQETGLTELAVLQILAALAHLKILDVDSATSTGASSMNSAATATSAQDIRVKAARVEEMRAHDEVTQLLDRLPPLVSQLAYDAKAATPEKMAAAGPTAEIIAQSFGPGRRILDVLQERNYTLEMVRAVTALFQSGVLRQTTGATQTAPAASWTPATPAPGASNAASRDGSWQVPKSPLGGGMPQAPIGGGMPQNAGFPAPKAAPPIAPPMPGPSSNQISPPPWTGARTPSAPPASMNAGFPAMKSDSMSAGFPATKSNSEAPIPIEPPMSAPMPAPMPPPSAGGGWASPLPPSPPPGNGAWGAPLPPIPPASGPQPAPAPWSAPAPAARPTAPSSWAVPSSPAPPSPAPMPTPMPSFPPPPAPSSASAAPWRAPAPPPSSSGAFRQAPSSAPAPSPVPLELEDRVDTKPAPAATGARAPRSGRGAMLGALGLVLVAGGVVGAHFAGLVAIPGLPPVRPKGTATPLAHASQAPTAAASATATAIAIASPAQTAAATPPTTTTATPVAAASVAASPAATAVAVTTTAAPATPEPTPTKVAIAATPAPTPKPTPDEAALQRKKAASLARAAEAEMNKPAPDYPKATAAAKQAISLDPKNPDGYFWLATAYVASNDMASAKKPLQEYFKVAAAGNKNYANATAMKSMVGIP